MPKQNQLLQDCFESLANCIETRTKYQYSHVPHLSKQAQEYIDTLSIEDQKAFLLIY